MSSDVALHLLESRTEIVGMVDAIGDKPMRVRKLPPMIAARSPRSFNIQCLSSGIGILACVAAGCGKRSGVSLTVSRTVKAG